MYMPWSFGIFMLLTLMMFIAGHFITVWKMYKRSLEHTEKCCGCDKKEEKKEEKKVTVPTAGAVVDAVSNAVDTATKFIK